MTVTYHCILHSKEKLGNDRKLLSFYVMSHALYFTELSMTPMSILEPLGDRTDWPRAECKGMVALLQQ